MIAWEARILQLEAEVVDLKKCIRSLQEGLSRALSVTVMHEPIGPEEVKKRLKSMLNAFDQAVKNSQILRR